MRFAACGKDVVHRVGCPVSSLGNSLGTTLLDFASKTVVLLLSNRATLFSVQLTQVALSTLAARKLGSN